ncbi:ATPase [Treponema primitia ZAS-2]|uniref:ATPase n=1 Tax=Treponema primitia (strain ATCC BAA-887 / DSM 12427 / ZAS-2) TaxID=545694 RepID=F5YQJ5_TREPZ|nr:ATP-binding protein [Treponema primitia]AEF84630.1 ATPase [Treponema primitia ZAS-2]
MNKNNLIERKQYMQILRDLKDQHIIKVITGVRRCGKSTLLEMFADELLQSGIKPEQIQFLNFEDPDIYTIGDWKAVYDHIKVQLLPDKMNYVFLDEVQNIDVFQRLVDGLFIKKNVDLYITGSNAHLLSGELATLLTGRYIETNILPLQLAEIYDFKSKPPNLSKLETLAAYLQEGGIPEYYNQKQISQKQADKFVESVLNTIIEKDIFQRLVIKDKHNFNKIIDFVFDSVGSFVSPRSISDTLRTHGTIIDKEAVARYLDAMCDAFLIYKVPRYEIKGKGLLQTLNKYYLVDPCFRKVRLKREMSKDRPHWLENAVYFELIRRYRDVLIGKTGNLEVDFVVTDHEGYTSYYQVSWTTENPETLERELAPLNAIKDSNPKYLLTTDIDFNPVYNGIRKLNVTDWMLGNK